MIVAETKYGFRWGVTLIERLFSYVPRHGMGTAIAFSVKTDCGQELQISVSPKGHSIRVFDVKANRELR